MKHTKVWLGVFALGFAALVFWRSGIHALACESIYPYQKACVWFKKTIGSRIRAACTRANSAVRVAMLERDVARLRMTAAEVDSLVSEVDRLREQLAYVRKTVSRCQPAVVLSRGGTAAIWQTLRVARGAADGVRRGDPVVVPDGLVGRVVETTPHTSEVMLISDPNSRVACELEVPSEGFGAIRGILYGGGARPGREPTLTLLYVVEPLRLRYLARDFEPPPRTSVITSGLGQTFPKGLKVGYLLESRVEKNGLTREAMIVPAVDLAGLEEVFILSTREAADAR